MKNFIVLGDSTTHGGTVITAWGRDSAQPTTIDGIPIACVGDKVTCPRCKGTHTIIGGADGPRVEIDGRLAARHGDGVSDGSKLVSSQSNAWHNG